MEPESLPAAAFAPLITPPSTEARVADNYSKDDAKFLGSVMEAAGCAVAAGSAQALETAGSAPSGEVVVKRKRGRPPKNRDGTKAAPPIPVAAKRKEDDEEVVCFICFDGGDLVVCDRRGCPKVYHPLCIHRDEAFFRTRGKWDCGWHICSICEKAALNMCYTCTFSLCKGCADNAKFFCVRGNKGFCETCFSTIMLIESEQDVNSQKGQVRVDFDDKSSWEYLFKLYWLDQKMKLSLTLDELISAKNRSVLPQPPVPKDESSDELYDANNDPDDNSDSSSGKRRRKTRMRKRRRNHAKTTVDLQKAPSNIGTLIPKTGHNPKAVLMGGKPLPEDCVWASPHLLDFVGHMKQGDRSYVSQFDVQALLLEYIKRNNLRDPRKKSQIICDGRLLNLFRKPRVAHFEMLKLLESHYVVKENFQGVDGHNENNSKYPNEGVGDGYGEMTSKPGSGKRQRKNRKMEREQTNVGDYAAIDMHNINLIYFRRCLVEDLIDDTDKFTKLVAGAFVRIRIGTSSKRQDIYRLVKVIGTRKVSEKYKLGMKMTDVALEIQNLDKKEVTTVDAISNQEFTEDECKRLRQSMKYGLVDRLKVSDVLEKARILKPIRDNEWLENEKQKLSHLRDRASETGRRKELKECVERLKLINSPEERIRRINEVPEVHVDLHMNPDYESPEENMGIINGKSGKSKFPWMEDDNITNELLPPTSHNSSNRTEVEERNHRATPVVSTEKRLSPGIPSQLKIPVTDKIWHYRDPALNIQGPFSMEQLARWSIYFPLDLRIWLAFESEEHSKLLTDVLPRYQEDSLKLDTTSVSVHPLSHAGMGGYVNKFDWQRNNTSVWPSGTQNQIIWNSSNNLSAVPQAVSNYAHSVGFSDHITNWLAPQRDAAYMKENGLPESSKIMETNTIRDVHPGRVESQTGLAVELKPSQGNTCLQSPAKSQVVCAGQQTEKHISASDDLGLHYEGNSRDNIRMHTIDLPTLTQQSSRDSTNFPGTIDLSIAPARQVEPDQSPVPKIELNEELKSSVNETGSSNGSSVNVLDNGGFHTTSEFLGKRNCQGSHMDPSTKCNQSKIGLESSSNQQDTRDNDSDALNTETHQSSSRFRSKEIKLEKEGPSPTLTPDGHPNKCNELDRSASSPKAQEISVSTSLMADSTSCGPSIGYEVDTSRPVSHVRIKKLEVQIPVFQMDVQNNQSHSIDGRKSVESTAIAEALAHFDSDSYKEQANNSYGILTLSSDLHGFADIQRFTSPVGKDVLDNDIIPMSPWKEESYFTNEHPWVIQEDLKNDGWSLHSPTPAWNNGDADEAKYISSAINEASIVQSNIDDACRVPPQQQKDELVNGYPQTDHQKQVSLSTTTMWDSSVQATAAFTSCVHSIPNLNLGSNWGDSSHVNFTLGIMEPTVADNMRRDPGTGSSSKPQIVDLNTTWGITTGSNSNCDVGAGVGDWNAPQSNNNGRHGDGRHFLQDEGHHSRHKVGYRGQPQRGICKFYENGFCRKGSSCNYLHH